MRVLVIGAGYVGLELGRRLAGCGHEVFGLRRGAAAAPCLEAAGLKPLAADITRPETLAGLPSQFDWVANCVSAGRGGAEDYRRVYLDGTRNLLRWLSASPPGKFVYTGSTGVYGQNDGSVVDESAPVEPPSETGRVLAMTEAELLAAARERGFPAVVLRVAGIYGPGRGWWFKQFLEGAARIEGDGGRYLNMIHRDDAAGCVQAALERGRPGEIYNAVDDEPVTQRDFFAWLAGRLGRPPPPAGMEAAAGGPKRGVSNKRVSNRKLKAELERAFRFPTFRKGYAAEVGAVLRG